MKIAPRDIAATLAKPAPKFLCYFFHGSDLGLVRERALTIAKQIVSDLDDPFQSVTLRGDVVKDDPSRLIDEVTALAVFGDERLVRLRGTGTEMLEAVKQAVPFLKTGTRLVIEASDTTTKHAIVKFCEGEQQVASIGCYADEDKDIGQLARQIFANESITIDQEAMQLLVSRLGGDRLASRSELEKLALLAGPNGQLTADDIDEALGDSSAQAIDLFMKSVLTGDASLLAKSLEKARQEEIAPIAILRQLSYGMRQIFEAAALIEKGEAPVAAIGRLRPPVHFKAKPLFTAAANRLSKNQALQHWQKVNAMEADLKSGRITDAYTHLGQGLLGLCLRMKTKR